MKDLIIDRIRAIESYKKSKSTIPSCATKHELRRAVFKSFEKSFSELVEDGKIEITGHTVNGDEHLKLL